MDNESIQQVKTSFVGHILAFLFMLLVVIFLTMSFQIMIFLGVFILLVILFWAGYGISALLGLVCGIILWFVGVFAGIIGFISGLFHPFGLHIFNVAIQSIASIKMVI